MPDKSPARWLASPQSLRTTTDQPTRSSISTTIPSSLLLLITFILGRGTHRDIQRQPLTTKELFNITASLTGIVSRTRGPERVQVDSVCFRDECRRDLGTGEEPDSDSCCLCSNTKNKSRINTSFRIRKRLPSSPLQKENNKTDQPDNVPRKQQHKLPLEHH
jgi:hypothetical protein